MQIESTPLEGWIPLVGWDLGLGGKGRSIHVLARWMGLDLLNDGIGGARGCGAVISSAVTRDGTLDRHRDSHAPAHAEGGDAPPQVEILHEMK